MEEADFKKFLSVLRRIQPTDAYQSRSKPLIVLARQEQPLAAPALPRVKLRLRIFESLTVTGAIALASFLIIAALGSMSIVNLRENGTLASSLSSDSLVSEAKSANFDLQIKEVTYFDESSKQVALALDKISKDNGSTVKPQ